MPEINDSLLLNEAGNPNNPAAGLPRQEIMRGNEVVNEVWEEKNDKDINIISCTSISFAQGETLELQPGQTKKLEVVQDPFISNIPYLTFESSDLNVVQIIDDCVAYACGEEGEAIVTASSSDGSELVATITITVAKKTQEEEGGEEEPEPEEGKGEFIKPTLPEHVYVGEEYNIEVGFKSDSNISGVKFVFSTSGPGNVTYKMTDSLGTEFTFQNNGEWGPAEGFDIVGTPENPYEAVTPVSALFEGPAGEYSFTTKLVKAVSGEVVNEDVATITVEVPVVSGEETTVTTQALKSKKKS